MKTRNFASSSAVVESPVKDAGARTSGEIPTGDNAIRELAYTYYEKDGRPEGKEMDHWLRAETALAPFRTGDAESLALSEH